MDWRVWEAANDRYIEELRVYPGGLILAPMSLPNRSAAAAKLPTGNSEIAIRCCAAGMAARPSADAPAICIAVTCARSAIRATRRRCRMISSLIFFGTLNWIDNRPLQIEEYRKDLFSKSSRYP